MRGASVAVLDGVSAHAAVLQHRCELGCCSCPRAGAPYTGGGRGGAGWVRGGFGDVLALLSSSKARGLMQGGHEAPAGTDTKAAALRFLHARWCLEESCEVTSSQEWGGGNPAGRDPQDREQQGPAEVKARDRSCRPVLQPGAYPQKPGLH